jgi:hypothetical protein
MAIDGKKLLSLERNDLAYMSTIYLQEEFIQRLVKNFKDEWDNSSNINLESLAV